VKGWGTLQRGAGSGRTVRSFNGLIGWPHESLEKGSLQDGGREMVE
jgi:hypothetical protein